MLLASANGVVAVAPLDHTLYCTIWGNRYVWHSHKQVYICVPVHLCVLRVCIHAHAREYYCCKYIHLINFVAIHAKRHQHFSIGCLISQVLRGGIAVFPMHMFWPLKWVPGAQDTGMVGICVTSEDSTRAAILE